MAITSPVYCTREDVKSALDYNETSRSNAKVDRAVEAGSRAVEGLLHRTFLPVVATRYFDWPTRQGGRTWRLWLDDNELISATTVTSAGTAISSNDYFLEPANYGPPYDRVEIDLGSSASFEAGDTHQRAVAITGLWGYQDTTTPVGTIVEALDASETGIDVSDSSLYGVGSVLKVDSERLMVTDKTMLTTGITTGSSLTAQKNSQSLTVSDGTQFHVGETLLIDSERVVVDDVAGNTLTLRRGTDGTTLAAHNTGVTIYAPRTLTVQRGALGTTAATHSSSATLSLQTVPGLVRQLAVAEAVSALKQEGSGYASESGSGENSSPGGSSVGNLRQTVYSLYGRQARMWAV